MNRIKPFYDKQEGIAPFWKKAVVSFAVGSLTGGVLHMAGAPQPMVMGVSTGVTAAIFLTFGRNAAK